MGRAQLSTARLAGCRVAGGGWWAGCSVGWMVGLALPTFYSVHHLLVAGPVAGGREQPAERAGRLGCRLGRLLYTAPTHRKGQ